MKEIRDEIHSSRISFETKNELLRLNKECGISSGDILTNYVENKCNINAHEILLKINLLEDRLGMIERLEREQNKILNYLKEEHKYILNQIKKLDNLKSDSDMFHDDIELNIKSSVKAFFNIRKQHTSTYGIIDSDFDAIKVGRNLCGRYNVNHSAFSKSVELIENGLNLEEFMSSDLSKYGVI